MMVAMHVSMRLCEMMVSVLTVARARGEQRQGESKSKRQKGKGQKAEEKGQGRARAACQKLWKALHGICFYYLRSWERSGVETKRLGEQGQGPRQGQGKAKARAMPR